MVKQVPFFAYADFDEQRAFKIETDTLIEKWKKIQMYQKWKIQIVTLRLKSVKELIVVCTRFVKHALKSIKSNHAINVLVALHLSVPKCNSF